MKVWNHFVSLFYRVIMFSLCPHLKKGSNNGSRQFSPVTSSKVLLECPSVPPRRRMAWELPNKDETCSASLCNPKPKPSPSPSPTVINSRIRIRTFHLKYRKVDIEGQYWQEVPDRGFNILAFRHSKRVSALQSSRKREEAEKPRALGRGGKGVEGGGGDGAGRLFLPRRGVGRQRG